jgi:hypothetical protein
VSFAAVQNHVAVLEFPIVRLVRQGRLVGAFWFSQLSPEGGEFTLDAVQLCPSIS